MLKTIRNILLWLPFLLYFGERSYIAQDEGYYALQAKWILQKGEWIAPMWWDEISFDRTNGIQWLIAISQSLFGETILASHLPSLLAGFITLLVTYKLSEELIGKEYNWLSPLILCTSFIWINNLHLATQDMPLLALEMIGIYSLLKSSDRSSRFYNLIFGLWIGPACLLKTGMVLVPLICISPYIITKKRYIINSLYFWLGLLIGLIPLITWLAISIQSYGLQSVKGIIDKVYFLSQSNNYHKPLLYYTWNIPINSFPWIFFSIIDVINKFKTNKISSNYPLYIYPLSFIILLSLFKTKTSYYPLQIAPLIAISSCSGIKLIVKNKHILSKYFRKYVITLSLFLITILFYLLYSSSNIDFIDQNRTTIMLSVILFFVPWLLVYFFESPRKIITCLIIGPYLSYSLIIQNGFLTNRDPATKYLFNSNPLLSIINKNTIDVFYTNELNSDDFSKLVKIGIYTKKLGKRIKSINHNESTNPIWIHSDSTTFSEDDLSLILDSKELSPWVLVRRKNLQSSNR
ncbi:ArnT family glycosyltransferase [Prochlorococcus sp. MIT 1223]|uniref:ArnT family glycosyltransferase n=1 Tax=Prochlorococcus sp. MIT 1223 TaxID=3096217 RepID=UPI002A766300|nr:glycosyltransferase family 39 protein [Prochlorococcus sp. MIT 1223]